MTVRVIDGSMENFESLANKEMSKSDVVDKLLDPPIMTKTTDNTKHSTPISFRIPLDWTGWVAEIRSNMDLNRG